MTSQGYTNTTADVLPALVVRQTRRLLTLMYAQAFFLAVTYLVGVWLAIVMASSIGVTQPEVVVHVILASTLASLTASLGFMAVLQHQKDIAFLNIAFFLVIVGAGVAGFMLLGDTSSGAQVTMTNLTMVSVAAFGMPITGYSMDKEARIVRANGVDSGEGSPAAGLAMLGLIALAITAAAGVSTRVIALASSLASLYATAVAIHFGLAAVTISMVLGVLVLSMFEAAGPQSQRVPRQRALFAILGLAAVCMAGGAGVIAAGLVPGAGATTTYLVMMGEAVAFVYGFLVLAITTPFKGRARRSASEGSP
ncbi:MAG: hypothetical protein JRN56_05425 [Nitrososphaerota archaeon]|jgi:hypothetical protein|nr:hypothetical protein [Nitrososphaerota archaeon]MDG6913173.1 hypothetical protein [Nitrososphaerota archaeon]MDG6961843.1 hypothetical protein [Nitrososphaerota archaeon]MDG6962534.1 hypothetical protein [Nitrososphaerota archaeon]MDG6980664.1 hypothetical protein [Nitrososphaerota archaeon]